MKASFKSLQGTKISDSRAGHIIRALVALLVLVVTVPASDAAELLNENFDSYTSTIPTVAVGTTTGVKAVGQTTAISGISQIGLGGKVAYLNDVGQSSGQLELNAGSAAQTTLTASFEIYNNATPSASGTQPINIGLNHKPLVIGDGRSGIADGLVFSGLE